MNKVVTFLFIIFVFVISIIFKDYIYGNSGKDSAWDILLRMDTINPPNRKYSKILIDRLINEYPETEFGWYARGAWAALNENLDTAISHFDKALEKNKSFYHAHSGKAHLFLKMKDYSRAMKEFEATLKIKSDYVPVYASRAWLKNRLKDYRGAIADHTQVIEKADGRYAFYRLLSYKNRGRVKLRLNDFRGAINDYTMAIKLNPRYAEAYYDRAKAWGNLRNQTEACADLKKARDLGHTGGEDMLRKYCR